MGQSRRGSKSASGERTRVVGAHHNTFKPGDIDAALGQAASHYYKVLLIVGPSG